MDRLAIHITVAAKGQAAILHIQHRGADNVSHMARGFAPGTIVQDVVDQFHRETKIDKAALMEAYRRWWLGHVLPVYVER